MKKLICITLLALTTNLIYSQKDSIVYGLILQINDTYFSRANCYTGEIEVLSSFPISNYYSIESGCAYNSIDSIYYFIGEDFGGSTKLFSIKTTTGNVQMAVELPYGPIYKHLFFSEKDEKLYCISYHSLSYFLSELNLITAEYTDVSSALPITNVDYRYKTVDKKSNSIVLFGTIDLEDSTIIAKIFVDEKTASETKVSGIFNPVFSFNNTNNHIGLRYDSDMPSGSGLLSEINIEADTFVDISTIDPGYFEYYCGNNSTKSDKDSTIILVINDGALGSGDNRFLCINRNSGNILSYEKISLNFDFANIVIESSNPNINYTHEYHKRYTPIIYPNPVNSSLTFEFDQYPVELRIFNIQNKLIFKKTIKESSFKLNTSNFASGTYIYTVTLDQYITAGKLVVK